MRTGTARRMDPTRGRRTRHAHTLIPLPPQNEAAKNGNARAASSTQGLRSSGNVVHPAADLRPGDDPATIPSHHSIPPPPSHHHLANTQPCSRAPMRGAGPLCALAKELKAGSSRAANPGRAALRLDREDSRAVTFPHEQQQRRFRTALWNLSPCMDPCYPLAPTTAPNT